MRDRRRKRAGGQAENQQRYAQLIAGGVTNSEACRLVGIDRKTGNRWRYGRKVRNSAGALVIYPPVKIEQAKPRSPRYLSEQERIRIADLLCQWPSVSPQRWPLNSPLVAMISPRWWPSNLPTPTRGHDFSPAWGRARQVRGFTPLPAVACASR